MLPASTAPSMAKGHSTLSPSSKIISTSWFVAYTTYPHFKGFLIKCRAAFWRCSREPAIAGPPYISDDPEPTDYQHFEIYMYNLGTAARNGSNGQSGIGFDYGAAPDPS